MSRCTTAHSLYIGIADIFGTSASEMGTRTLGGEREARLPADEHGPRRAGQRGPREGGLAMGGRQCSDFTPIWR